MIHYNITIYSVSELAKASMKNIYVYNKTRLILDKFIIKRSDRFSPTMNIITALNGWIEKCATTELTLLLRVTASFHFKRFTADVTKAFLFCHKDRVEKRVVVHGVVVRVEIQFAII